MSVYSRLQSRGMDLRHDVSDPADWTGVVWSRTGPHAGSGLGGYPMESAMQITVVRACALKVAGAIARAPIYVEHPDGTSDEAPDWLVQPDPETTCSDVVSQMIVSLMLDGNAYAFVTRRRSGSVEPESIMVLSPREVGVTRPTVGGLLEYRVNGEVVPRDRVIHAKGMCLPGDIVGSGVLIHGARLMALATAETNYAALRFARGDRSPGIFEYALKSPAALKQEQADAVVRDIKRKADGQSRGPVFLHSGMDVVKLEFSSQELELISSRKFTDVQLCTMMGVQPHMVGVETENNQTYKNVLMDMQGFKVFTLEDWANRLGTGLAAKTLPRGDVLRFDLDELSADLAMSGTTMDVDASAMTAKITQGAQPGQEEED